MNRDDIASGVQVHADIVVAHVVPLINVCDEASVEEQFVSGIDEDPENSAFRFFFEFKIFPEEGLFCASSP